jgi:PIN domain nuclease of toxin-antitoxin system
MRFLLDTQIAVWIPVADRRISRVARSILNSTDNEFTFSTASIWEIAIKRSLNRCDFLFEPGEIRRQMIENGYEELPVMGHHAVAVGNLPHLHKDPFDRILIAQAMVEGITLLTADPMIASYPGPIRKV